MAEDPKGLDGVTTLEVLAERVARGAVVHEDDARVIVGTHDLIAVGMMADEVRRQLHGTETTFVRVFEIRVDAVPASLPPRVAAGEFRVVGRPESLDAACAAVTAARRLAHRTPFTGFSLADLDALHATCADAYFRLKDAGLDGISEVAIDQLTGPVSPRASGGARTAQVAAAVEAARAAGLHVQRITVHAPPADPVRLIADVVELQRTTGSFNAFAPLPRTTSVATPTTGYDDVKLVALARLMVREIPSIQVDWPLYGPKLAQVALTVGADDVDGIAAVESGALGPRRSAIEEIRGNIRAAGLQPLERNGVFARGEQATDRRDHRGPA